MHPNHALLDRLWALVPVVEQIEDLWVRREAIAALLKPLMLPSHRRAVRNALADTDARLEALRAQYQLFGGTDLVPGLYARPRPLMRIIGAIADGHASTVDAAIAYRLAELDRTKQDLRRAGARMINDR